MENLSYAENDTTIYNASMLIRQKYKDSWYTMIGLGILLGFSAIISYTPNGC